MKILLSNKFYYRRGGAEVYTYNLEQLLRRNAHETAVFAMQHPENFATQWSKYFPSEVDYSAGKGSCKAVIRPFGTREVKAKFNALIDDFRPEVLHLNNIHSQLSPVIAQIAHERRIKIVWTLHDFKFLCPRYDCLRNGKEICENCFTDKHCVLSNRCMKNSFFASVIAYFEALKWTKDKLESFTDIFICPSRFIADKMVQGGLNKSKIKILCNFIDVDKTKKEDYSKEDYYCYMGRLSHEKGIETLVNAAMQLPYKLKIIGDGPLKEVLYRRQSKNSDIEFVGHKQWDEIKEIVGKARFSVIPSEWYENNPLSAIESLCLGTPVLGANIGGIPELIEDGKLGMLFESRNTADLKEKIEKMFETKTSFDYKKIAENAAKKFSSGKYYLDLMNIYTK